MTSLGVRQLKAQLSHHLRRAQTGTRLTITDRGRPIAVLSPIETGIPVAWAHKMVADQRAVWSGGKPSGLATRVPARGQLASHQILEDRR